jgi:hypothetical protein
MGGRVMLIRGAILWRIFERAFIGILLRRHISDRKTQRLLLNEYREKGNAT